MKISIDKRGVLLFVILLSILRPYYIPPTLNIIFRILQGLSLILLLFLFFNEKIENNSLIGSMTLYYVLLLIVTIICKGSTFEVLKDMGTLVTLSLWMHVSVRYDSVLTVKMLILMFEILVYLNLLSIILYPNGMYVVENAVYARYGWLLGQQNVFSMYESGALCVAAIYTDVSESIVKWSRFLCLVVAIVCQVVFFKSAINTVTFALMAVGLLILFISKKQNINVNFVFSVIVIAFVTIVLSQKFTNQLGNLSGLYFDRTESFYSRLHMWEIGLSEIPNHFLLGHGLDIDYMMRRVHATHFHNQYIETLYEVGIFGLVLYMNVLYISLRNVADKASNFSGKMVIMGMISLLISNMFDVYFNQTMGRIVLLIAFYYPNFVTEFKSDIIEQFE